MDPNPICANEKGKIEPRDTVGEMNLNSSPNPENLSTKIVEKENSFIID